MTTRASRIAFVPILALLLPPGACHAARDAPAKIERLYQRYARAFPAVRAIDVATVRAATNRNLVIVDVRTQNERAVSMIPGAISREAFEASVSFRTNAEIIVYCTIGARSGKYASRLVDRGYDAYNLRGGVLAWAHSGGTFTNDQGVTRRVHVYGKKWNLLPPSYRGVW